MNKQESTKEKNRLVGFNLLYVTMSNNMEHEIIAVLQWFLQTTEYFENASITTIANIVVYIWKNI